MMNLTNSLAQPPLKLRAQAEQERRRRQRISERPDYSTEDGIILFVRDVLHGEPKPYQEDILRRLVRSHRVAVRGPRGLGKTTLIAWVVLWLMVAHGTDTKVGVTAGSWGQLHDFTWKEIHKWSGKADWSKVGISMTKGRELLDTAINLPDKSAFSVSSNRPELVEGAHASVVAFIVDEAKAVSNEVFDAIEGTFSNAGADTDKLAFALAVSTPGSPSGRFYDIHSRKAGYEDWDVVHVTLEQAISAGAVSAEWAAKMLLQWGEASPAYQAHVLGEFPDDSSTSVIPLSWIEASNERWRERSERSELSGKVALGVDPAGMGRDKTAICRLVGNFVQILDLHSHIDTVQIAGLVASLSTKSDPIGVDVIGLGKGVYDTLKHDGYIAAPINVATSTPLKDATGVFGFVNLRSALWWMLREVLNPENHDILLSIPPEDILTGDLSAPTWTYTLNGRIQVESKDDMRKRIGRSTDKADALALALYAQSHISTGYIKSNPSNPFAI